MYTPPIYGLSLQSDGKGSFVGLDQKALPASGYGAYNLPMGGSYTDRYQNDRAASPVMLVREMVGIAWACSAICANLIARLKLHMYEVTRPGQRKTKYREAYERLKGYSPNGRITGSHRRSLQTKGNLGMNPGYSFATDANVEEVFDHPLLDLLRNPEPTNDDIGLTGYDHRWATQLFMESVGKSYWLVERDKKIGVPKHLWLLHSQYVKEIPDESGIKFIAYYEYGVGGNKEKYSAEDVIKLHIPDLGHLRLGGFSPLQSAFEAISLIRKGDAQINSLLKNMGLPGVIASPKASETGTYFSPETARRMQSSLNALLREGGNGGTVVLPEPMELEIPAWKPVEIISDEKYEQLKETVANCFGIPTSVLKRNDSNLASAKTGDRALAIDAGMPRAARYELMLNNRIVPMFDKERRYFVSLESPVPEDELFALEAAKASFGSGAFTVDEYRESIGLPPLGGKRGNDRYINGSLIGEEDGIPIMAVQQDGLGDNGMTAKPSSAKPSTKPADDEPVKKPKKKKPPKPVKKPKRSGKSVAEIIADKLLLHSVQPSAKEGDMAKTIRELTRTVEKMANKKSPELKIVTVHTSPDKVQTPEPSAPPAKAAPKDDDERLKSVLVAAGYTREQLDQETEQETHIHDEL